MFKSIKAKIKKEWYTRIKGMSVEEIKIHTWRQQGMKIGENVHIYSEIFSKEPYMISIGDNTTISGNVSLVTHDNSISKYLPEFTDTFGEIVIGENCFIGMGSMILAGVTLPPNTIVGAGAVVTNSIQEQGCVLGGCPAKIIGHVDELRQKNYQHGLNIRGLSAIEKRELLLKSHSKLIKR